MESEIPIPEYDYDDGLRALEDFSNRVKVTSDNLPSCCFFTFTHAEGKLICASMSPDVEKVVGGFSDSVVRTWDLTSGENDDDEDNEEDDEKEVGGKETADGGTTTETGENKEKTKKVYKRGDKIGKSMKVKEFIGHSAPVHDVQYSPDGIYLLSVSRDCTARMWSCNSKSHFARTKATKPRFGARNGPRAVTILPLVPTTEPVESGRLNYPPRSELSAATSATSIASRGTNSNYVATGSSDRTVRLWDVSTGRCTRLFAGHTSGVTALAFSPDGQSISTADDSGIIHSWDLDSGHDVSKPCSATKTRSTV